MPAGAMPRLRHLPLPVAMLGLAAFGMLLPAAQALALGQDGIAGAFLGSGALALLLALLLALALATRQRRQPAQGLLQGLVLGYLLLPPVLALPLAAALPGLGLSRAWFEMVSALTTTGATLLDPATLPAPLHLWRGLVGWGGGFLVLVAAVGILAGLNLGGFELYAPHAAGRVARLPPQAGAGRDPSDRLAAQVAALAPLYLGLTLALWLALRLAGDPPLVGLLHAMAVLSTSGITPLAGGLAAAPSGHLGEALLLGGLAVALSRRFTPGALPPPAGAGLLHDPELRLGLALVVLVALVIAARHLPELFAGTAAPPGLLRRIWAALFTALSFLTTTGFTAADWGGISAGPGQDAPGLMLIGLAIVGGGVGTAAGGVTLLRLWALLALARREMERLALPDSIGGGGAPARQLRGEGALVAFVFLMLFALTLGAVHLALSALGYGFEQALVLAVAAVATVGPLGGSAADWAALDPGARSVLAMAMVVGRLETLVLLALLVPAAWGARQ